MSKPVILLCWGYNRPGWIKYFEQLNDDFEFIYLFYMYPDEEKAVYTSNKRIYYTQYNSPLTLLRKNKISKIIFMGMDGWQNIGINIAAKRLGIPAYYMMHGAATISFDDYSSIVYQKRNLFKEIFTRKIYLWIFNLRFLLNALGFKYLKHFPRLLKLQVQKTFGHPAVALRKNKLWLRNPEKYIVYSNEDKAYYIEQDGCSQKDFLVLGNPEITSFIEYAAAHGVKEENYILYIETPLSKLENIGFDVNILSREEHNKLLEGINKYAKRHGLKLYVKRHPYTFDSPDYYTNENVVYFKQTEIEPLILNAKAIIAYNSSLVVPAIYFKNCCLVRIKELDLFQSKLAELGVCYIVDYEQFISENYKIRFLDENDPVRKDEFIEKFIAPNDDGRGVHRLKQILMG